MQLKKLLALLLAGIMIFSLAACGSDDPTVDEPDDTPSSSEPEKDDTPTMALNPLTGEYTLDPAEKGKKPVAIMINNVSVAQKVQSGISSADVVFETEVEGGITRLLAVFSDVSKVGKIGTLRSLRVPYADIACGMNALLFYHGMDEDYCRPHVRSIGVTYTEISNSKYCYRENNGLAYEHRLYTSGEQVAQLIADKGLNTEGSTEPWLNFSDKADKTAAGTTVANAATVKFNGANSTKFVYDATAKKYIRTKNGTPFVDLGSGTNELFTNVFVLTTTISNYPDGYHRRVDFTGGSGYYISAGGATEIKWTKGASANGFSFTTVDGQPLTVNQGNSFVCISAGTVAFE